MPDKLDKRCYQQISLKGWKERTVIEREPDRCGNLIESTVSVFDFLFEINVNGETFPLKIEVRIYTDKKKFFSSKGDSFPKQSRDLCIMGVGYNQYCITLRDCPSVNEKTSEELAFLVGGELSEKFSKCEQVVVEVYADENYRYVTVEFRLPKGYGISLEELDFLGESLAKQLGGGSLTISFDDGTGVGIQGSSYDIPAPEDEDCA
ncbi:MAG: hypothetical protein ACOX2O_07000 [Bdellovibrionota bacterium]|jgi:hypothetical protein